MQTRALIFIEAEEPIGLVCVMPIGMVEISSCIIDPAIKPGARLIHVEDYKLKAPRQVVEASEAYREENDWFAQFLEDCCDTGDPGASTKSGELYRTYRAWAASTGGYARSTTDFYNALERAGHRRSRTNKGSVVGGLTLKSAFDSQGSPF